METQRFRVDPKHLAGPESQQALDAAAAILRQGGTVAFPTETVYGLGANALDAQAVQKIFTAKARPNWDPLIVHVADDAMLQIVAAEISEEADKLIEAFWPGALTLLLPRSASIPDAVTAGRPLVGVRMPSHPVAIELIRRAGCPIAAPSANRFGHTSPTTAAHVLDDLDGRIDAVLDAGLDVGPTAFGVESTVFDPSSGIVYRPGAVTIEQLRSVAVRAEAFSEPDWAGVSTGQSGALPAALPSPGVGLKHYAPAAKLILVPAEELAAHAAKIQLEFPRQRLGILLPAGLPDVSGLPAKVEIFDWGHWSLPSELAQRLFAGLRALDARGCAIILCPLPTHDGIGVALRDRLRKAAL